MSDDSPYLDRLAEVVRKHREEIHEEGVCICGWHADMETDYPAHLASEIADALELSEERSVRRESYGYYTYPTSYRLVSPWLVRSDA